MKTMKIEAGKALDLEVAGKVLGRKIFTQEEMKEEALRVWREQPNCIYFDMGFRAWKELDNSITCVQKCPDYSTQIEEAWGVYKQIGMLMRLEDHGNDVWACEFLGVQPGPEDVIAKADTAPLAICAAALLVVEARAIEKIQEVMQKVDRCFHCGTGERLNLCLGCLTHFCFGCAGSHSIKHL